MSDSIRILSIDGGGIRGIIPAMVIQALLGALKARDVFHIIAGTSTGGIIACGLAKPNPVSLQGIIDLYVEHGSEILGARGASARARSVIAWATSDLSSWKRYGWPASGGDILTRSMHEPSALKAAHSPSCAAART
jgi:hypothetical protein